MPAQFSAQGNRYLLSSKKLSKALTAQDFDPDTLRSSDQIESQADGRGSAWFIRLADDQAVLRHYYRGGLVAKISQDRFFWSGVECSRAFVEYRLLEWMYQQGLPVPEPLGAHVQRLGMYYSCDIITRTISNTCTLADALETSTLPSEQWREVGRVVATMHALNVWHADLNARNILIDSEGVVSLIDFDRCRRRTGKRWQAANLARLKRSFDKLTVQGEITGFDVVSWQALLLGYQGQ